MRFRYVGYTAQGQETTGVVDTDSIDRAEEILFGADLTVVSLKKQAALPRLEELVPTLFGPRLQDVITFSRDLASILGSGISLLAALRILRDQARPGFGKVLQEVVNAVETGSSFSQACAAHPRVFPVLYLRLIAIGEEIGNLELVLRQVTSQLEKEMAARARILQSMAYPIFVLILGIATMFILVNVVLPSMKSLFAEFRAELPLTTRILVTGSAFLRANALYAIGALFLLVLLGWWYLRTPQGARWKDYQLMRLPVIGEVSRKGNLSRLARTLVLLQRAGVPLTETLQLMALTTQNVAIREAMLAVNEEVRVGQLLSQAMATQPLFPTLMVQMTSVGEQTGRLEVNMETVANYYEQETDKAVGRLVGMLGPALIILVGGLVGFIAVSVVTPMYSIIHQIK